MLISVLLILKLVFQKRKGLVFKRSFKNLIPKSTPKIYKNLLKLKVQPFFKSSYKNKFRVRPHHLKKINNTTKELLSKENPQSQLISSIISQNQSQVLKNKQFN